MTEYRNITFLECTTECEKIIADGGTILQKWTCAGCGARCVGNNPNMLTVTCHCEHCGTITDVLKTGCNYSAIIKARL